MNIKFIGQGHDHDLSNPTGQVIKELIQNNEYNGISILTAFTSYPGINGLARIFASYEKPLDQLFFVTGVDQKGTSKEALELLIELNIRAFVYFQPSRPIFHPKIYLFEGERFTSLIVGSSNLTFPGLFSNVESSILITVENDSDKDYQIVEEIKSYYKTIFEQTDPNLQPITQELITALVDSKIVPDESERKAKDEKDSNISTSLSEIIMGYFPRRPGVRIPTTFRRERSSKDTEERVANRPNAFAEDNDVNISPDYQMVWNSGKLTERDLNIPSGNNTNATGSMFFKKGLLKDIDQRHYFRDVIFNELDWVFDPNPRKSHIERASANFLLKIENEYNGPYYLTISHNSLTNTRAYEQKNSMTQLSWGPARNLIAKPELIGKSAKLFKSNIPEKAFILEIE